MVRAYVAGYRRYADLLSDCKDEAGVDPLTIDWTRLLPSKTEIRGCRHPSQDRYWWGKGEPPTWLVRYALSGGGLNRIALRNEGPDEPQEA